MDFHVLEPVIGPIISNGVLLFFLWVSRFPKTVGDNTEQLKALNHNIEGLTKIMTAHAERIEILEDRAKVYDRLHSDILQTPINTEAIAKDPSRYPQRRRRKADADESHEH